MLSIIKEYKKYNVAVFIAILLVLSSCQKADQEFVQKDEGYALGTTYHISYIVNNDSIDYKKEIEGVFTAMNKSMSTYLPSSDISKINDGDSSIVVDKYFKEVFLEARNVWQDTNGYYDPTVGQLVDAWGFGSKNGINEISKDQVDSLLNYTGFEKVALKDDNTIHKEDSHIYFDFNSLAKGYTIDIIGRTLEAKGVKNYVVEVGGEVLVKGTNTKDHKNWIIAVDDPRQVDGDRNLLIKLQLDNQAIATSGNYRKYRVDKITGERYVHIINPKTGYTQKSNILSTSVIAKTCMEADAYATAFMVMDLEQSKTLLKKHKDLEAFIVYTDDSGEMQEYSTDGFNSKILEREKP
ncbi:FAD:protein FMN transferase [Zhouia sp. PK063]|uniref:FAD:protein FMN transferase n=1 Tax=Zhouia sp. PK063 TaxID=3373602 RepID=UPI00378EC6BF